MPIRSLPLPIPMLLNDQLLRRLCACAGGKDARPAAVVSEYRMSQLKGVFSWRALLTVAGLFLFSFLAPLTWQRGQPSAAKHLGPSVRSLPLAPATTIIQRIEPEIVLISGEE